MNHCHQLVLLGGRLMHFLYKVVVPINHTKLSTIPIINKVDWTSFLGETLPGSFGHDGLSRVLKSLVW